MSLIKRIVKIRLDYANTGKLLFLQSILDESKRIINFYIDQLWDVPYCPKFAKYTDHPVETFLSGRMKSALMKIALENIRSQKNNRKTKKTKPIYTKDILTLSTCFVSFKYRDGLFDIILKLGSLTPLSNIHIVYLPSKKHRLFNKYMEDGWNLKNTIKLQKKDNRWYALVVFEKVKILKPKSKIVAIDCGYKHLAVTSAPQFIGSDLSKYIEKVSKKKQGSKAFKKSLIERNEYIRKEIKKIDLSNVSDIVVENLKYVKYKSKGRISKKFMNKLQRWNYRYFIDKLSDYLEVVGVQLSKVNPAYTSQICSGCGNKDPAARNLEEYKCKNCGLVIHADYNAAINILNRFLGWENMVPVEPNPIY